MEPRRRVSLPGETRRRCAIRAALGSLDPDDRPNDPPLRPGVGDGLDGVSPALASADEAPKIFHGVGTVTGVDAASGVLTVDHGDSPGFMDAMEMAYKVRPAFII